MLNALATWHQADSPWLHTDSDHQNLAPMYYKLSDPTLFSRDYIFRDDRYFRFYTPSFLTLVRIASTISGDYFHSVALLQAPILATYLIAAYALFWQVSRSRTVALVFSLFSIVGVSVIIDFWRVNGLGSMLPRTVALPLILLATFLLVRYLNPNLDDQHFTGQAWWRWLVLGLVIGGAANLHPTTGISLALVAVIVSLAARRRMKRPGWLHLLMLVIGTFIAAAPIVLNVFNGSNTSPASADFERFVSAFQARISMIPYSGSRLEGFTQESLYLLGFLWLLLTSVTWFLANPNRRSWAAMLFVSVQLAYVWLLVKNLDESLDVLMIVLAGGFFVWRWWVRDERGEMLWYEMIAAIVSVSFVLPLLLRIVWLNLEIWSLTTLVAELPRGARLLTIPFYLIGARFAFHLAQQGLRRDVLWLIFLVALSVLVWPSVWHLALLALLVFHERLLGWRETGVAYAAIYAGIITAVSVYMIYQIITRTDASLVAVVAGVYVTAAMLVLMRLHVSRTAMAALILLGAGLALGVLTAFNVIAPIHFANDSPWYTFALRGSPDFVTFLLASATGLGLWMVFRQHSLQTPLPEGEGGNTRGGLLTKVGDRLGRVDLFGWLVVALLGVMSIQTLGMVRFSLRPTDPDMTPALVQAAQWAEANTDLNALFFDTVGDGSAFRLWSLRSVTHGWKEMGLVGYSQPLDLAPMLARYRHIVTALETSDDVIGMAGELDADYIVRSADAPLDLPEAYRNDEVVIYQTAR